MLRRVLMVAGLAAVGAQPVLAQAFPPDASFVPGTQGSPNIKVLGHIPLGRAFSGSDIEMEQELSRPYVYTSVMLQTGTNIISIKDPAKPAIIWQWRAPNPELLSGTGAMDNKYFKHKGRYYDVQSVQFGNQGPMADIGAHVIDVTGLPDTAKIIDKGYIRTPDTRGGFHNIFMYKHSDGRPILFTTGGNPGARIYDMDKFLAGAPDHGMLGRVPVPEGAVRREGSNPGAGGYHDMYVGYDVAHKRDVFYGAGSGGYHVYDISNPLEPKLLTSIIGASGVGGGHTFTPDPTGRYVVTETEYQYAPLRIFDLKPTGDTLRPTINRPIGAWTARWKGLSHNHEVRWPYVFVSAYEDGLQIFNLMDPTNPYTVGYYDTYDGPNQRGWGGVQDPESGRGVTNGAFGVDVRNADGLIVLEDFRTGFWSFKMEGFDGWNGKQWGLPNISSVQDWDNGPEGAPKPQRIS